MWRARSGSLQLPKSYERHWAWLSLRSPKSIQDGKHIEPCMPCSMKTWVGPSVAQLVTVSHRCVDVLLREDASPPNLGRMHAASRSAILTAMLGTLEHIDDNLWHAVHSFRAFGIAVTSRMTVVRLSDGSLWLHSPIPLSADLQRQLDAQGLVRYVVAPNRFHHLYAGHALRTYPQATLFGAPGLRTKRVDLPELRELGAESRSAWNADLDEISLEGAPMLAESVWFHRATATLIATDLVEWLSGDLPWSARLYACMQGVRAQLAVPRSLVWTVKDRSAMRRSLEAVMQLPVRRLVVGHNVILDERHDAANRLRSALSAFLVKCV